MAVFQRFEAGNFENYFFLGLPVGIGQAVMQRIKVGAVPQGELPGFAKFAQGFLAIFASADVGT